MVQGADQEELVGFGGEGRPPREPLGARLRRHPWLVGLLALTVVGAGVAAVAIQRAGAPDLPTLTVRAVEPPADAYGSRVPNPWQAGTDGRPDGPADLERQADLTFGPSGGKLAVYGVAGPGVDVPEVPAFTLDETTRDKRLDVDTPVDCTKVPIPVPPDAYGVAVRVTDGARSTRGTVGAGDVGREWATAVQTACGSWLARTDVAISQAAVVPDPSKTRAQLTLTVANSGGTDAYVGTKTLPGIEPAITVTTTPTGAVRVPARGSARISADVAITQCDNAASIQTTGAGTDVPLPVTSDVIDLYASVGPASALTTDAPTWTTGLGPTSVLLSSEAAGAMSTGLRDACGGVQGFVAFVAPRGTSYDKASRVLTVPLLVNAPPGKVRDLRLVSSGTDFGPNSFTMIDKTTARLVPDRTGQVATKLRYRVPALRACSPLDTFLPGFEIVARVPAASGFRTVRFSQYGTQWDDKLVRDELCGAS